MLCFLLPSKAGSCDYRCLLSPSWKLSNMSSYAVSVDCPIAKCVLTLTLPGCYMFFICIMYGYNALVCSVVHAVEIKSYVIGSNTARIDRFPYSQNRLELCCSLAISDKHLSHGISTESSSFGLLCEQQTPIVSGFVRLMSLF
jgi:hypothetical protein